MSSLLVALEAQGFKLKDLDVMAAHTLQRMLSWRLPEMPSANSFQAMLAFSFDATRACHSLLQCPRPGPSNELLAATVEQFYLEQPHLHVLAQWEIASALLSSKKIPADRIHAVGVPGRYMNTNEILEAMVSDLSKLGVQDVVLLAHPDHLRRAYETIQHYWSTKPLKSMPRVLPAMAPYGLAWPSNRSLGSEMNLYAGVTGVVHSEGRSLSSSWYARSLGYFPDGDPQLWVHSREVWILYDHWAMCKGVATGIISL